jgi:hypothetical protein
MNDSELDAILKQMSTEHRPQLPSPGLIWFRAQIVRKAWQKERIERPLLLMRGFAGLIGAVILLLLVVRNWGQMQDSMDHRSWFLLPLLLMTLTASLAYGAILLWSQASGDKKEIAARQERTPR